jgi:hypothetical protein
MDGFLRHVGLAWFDKLGRNIRQKAAMDNANGLGHTRSFNELSVNFRFQVVLISSSLHSIFQGQPPVLQLILQLRLGLSTTNLRAGSQDEALTDYTSRCL